MHAAILDAIAIGQRPTCFLDGVEHPTHRCLDRLESDATTIDQTSSGVRVIENPLRIRCHPGARGVTIAIATAETARRQGFRNGASSIESNDRSD